MSRPRLSGGLRLYGGSARPEEAADVRRAGPAPAQVGGEQRALGMQPPGPADLEVRVTGVPAVPARPAVEEQQRRPAPPGHHVGTPRPADPTGGPVEQDVRPGVPQVAEPMGAAP